MAPKPYPWREAYLAALREYPVLQHACDVVDIDRTTAWRARQDDEDFAKAEKEAMEAGIDRAEKEAMRRGIFGYEEPVVYQGQLTPVWARDEHGELILEEYETDRFNKETGEPIIGKRPVQAKDANGNPQWLTVRKHSDALLALVLKGRRKSVYAERTEITGADGGPVETKDETTRAARLAALLALAQARKDAEDLG